MKVKTYVDESMKYLWIGMAISLFCVEYDSYKVRMGHSGFSFFYYAVWTGHFCFRKYYTVSAFGHWRDHCLGIGHRCRVCRYDYQMLFGAAAILISYIIPAYMLRHKNKIANQ